MKRWRFLLALPILVAAMGASPAWAVNYFGSYDVGGGLNDFATPVAAVTALKTAGNVMTGPVTLNVYTGTYDGQITISTVITGLNSTNRLVIQNAPGQAPIIINTAGTSATTGCGFYFNGYGKWITIRGLTITNCRHSAINVTATSSIPCSTLVIDSCYMYGTATYAAAKMVIWTYVRTSRLSKNKIEASGSYACAPFYMTYGNYDTVVNNMMSSTGTANSGSAYYIAEAASSTTNDQWYFNSFCGIDAGAALRLLGGTGCILKNNILYNGGETLYSGYKRAASFSAVTSLTSDYNIYYALADTAGEILVGSTNYSLRAFKAAYPALDQNSYSFDPNFTSAVSPFDLHLGGPSIADKGATPLAAVTTVDYDGNTRDGTNPDIGADEATPPFTQVLLGYRPIYPKVGPGITFQVDFLDRTNAAPTSPTVNLTGGINPSYTLNNPGGSYNKGVRLSVYTTPAPGTYTHSYVVSLVPLPALGTYPGPTVGTQFSGTYNIGGGSPMHYATLQAALTDMSNIAAGNGMIGATTLDVYSATHTGLVTVPTILGASAANRLVIENAPGYPVIITNATGSSATTACGFYVDRADYVTIRGFEITGCNWGAIYLAGTGADSCKSVYLENNYMHDNGVASATYNVVYMTYNADCRLTGNKIVGTANMNKAALYMYVGTNRTRLVNNIVTRPDQPTSATEFDVVSLSTCQYDEWYYNTIAGCNVANAFQNTGTPVGSVFKNNIFYNGGDKIPSDKAAWKVADISGVTSSDYNIFFVEGVDSGEVYFNSSAYSLAWLRTLGYNQHSYSFDPGFVSNVFPFDVHLASQPSVADSDATPLPAITTVDIDGNTRNATNPDIGAYEATLPSSDIIVGHRVLFPYKGASGVTQFRFAVDYMSRSNTAPSSPTVYLSGSPLGTLLNVNPPSYVYGVKLELKTTLAATGTFNHNYVVSSLPLPVTGTYPGPKVVARHGSFDVGGGAMDFATIAEAVAWWKLYGIDGNVVLNIFTGTYTVAVAISGTAGSNFITNLGLYNLTFQAATGQTPVQSAAFNISNGADNITLQGLKFTASNQAAGFSGTSGNPCDYITIRNCLFDNPTASGAATIYMYYPRNCLVEGNTIFTCYTGTALIANYGLEIWSGVSNNIIRNNTVYTSKGQTCATHRLGVAEWYNNTFVNLGGASGSNPNSSCFWMYTDATNSLTMEDNIFCSYGSSASRSCLYRSSGTVNVCPAVSDYNLFYGYAPTGYVYYAYGQTLAAYQAYCPGKDVHSLSCDPDFVYNGGVLDSTLHINRTSCANGAGIPITGVTVDRDGDVRNAFKPDIGADEVGPVTMPVDIGDHFCLYIEPGRETTIHWCFSHYGSPFFSWLPGCQYATPGCDEVCPPYTGTGPVTWTVTLDSSNVDCPLPGGWWTARFSGPGEGCVCVFFEYQLSVELMSFTATGGDGEVRLNWATASETNNDHFQVYRGNDHAGWDLLGRVNGHGTVATTQRYEFRDENVVNGQTYRYRLATVNVNGDMEWLETVVEATPQAAEVLPTEYALYQNYPNPFNPMTSIRFDLVETGWVTLKVYNPMGQEAATVVNGEMKAGRHTVTFDASHLPSGMYLYRLEASRFSATKKMLLMK